MGNKSSIIMSEKRAKQIRKLEEAVHNWSPSRSTLEMRWMSMQKSYSWPIPEAEDLEKYERLLPWSAERLIKMAENQSQHRMELEKKVINGAVWSQKAWVLFGWIIWISAIVWSVLSIMSGHDWAWGFLWTWWLTWLVSVFIYWTRMNSKTETPPQ